MTQEQVTRVGLLDAPIAFDELRDACDLYDHRYARYNLTRDAFRGSDAVVVGRSGVPACVDLGGEWSRGLLIRLLNAWGCRLPNPAPSTRSDKALGRHARTLAGLVNWWGAHAAALPVGQSLGDSGMLEDEKLVAAFQTSFEKLRSIRVADEATYRRSFSDVATSKVFYIVSPAFCLPWDRAIKRRCRLTKGSAQDYVVYLSRARERLQELRAANGLFESRLVEPSGYVPTGCEALNKYLFVTSR